MKRTITHSSRFKVNNLFIILFVMLMSMSTQYISAQNVTVAGAITGNGSYPDLGSAFTAINGGVQTGAIISVSIVGNTGEAASATLNQGAWTSLVLQELLVVQLLDHLSI